MGETLLPKNESQIRPLLQLESDSERVYVWNHIIEEDIKPTRANVTDAVNHFKDHPIDVEIIEEIETRLVETKQDGSFHTSSKENDWYTPSKYIESARFVLGSIDLDPATSELAQETVKASKYYTIDNSGLDEAWEGNVWMNPPYSMPEIQIFIDKLLNEKEVDQWIVLTNNSSDTGWFHKLLDMSDAVCFTKGRVGFENIQGDKMATRQGQTFFYFGEDVELFNSEFRAYGKIMSSI